MTPSRSIQVGRGQNPVERMAIEGRLERLSVKVDPKTGSINAASTIQGGMNGVARAAATTGAPGVLDFVDATKLRSSAGFSLTNAIQRLTGNDEGAVHRSTVRAATMALEGTTSAYNKGAAANQLAFQARLTKLEQTLVAAMDKKVLGFISKSDLSDLRKAALAYREEVTFQYGSDKLRGTQERILGHIAKFDAHGPAQYLAPWQEVTDPKVAAEVSPRVFHEIERVNEDGGKLSLMVRFDNLGESQWADDFLQIRYTSPDGKSSTTVEAARYDHVGFDAEQAKALGAQAEGLKSLPASIRDRITRFAGLVPSQLLESMKTE